MAGQDGEPDLVIPCKWQGYNDELRYAIRSMEHLPYRQLVICGYIPGWLMPDYALSFKQNAGSKYKNTTHIMKMACLDVNISDPFIWSNDDIFALFSIDSLPILNRGSLEDMLRIYTAKGGVSYTRGIRDTKTLMEQQCFEGPLLSYELHMPMLIHKKPMLECLRMAEGVVSIFHKRTFYGNYVDYGGETVKDSKVYKADQDWSTSFPFLSTSDDAFKHYYVGRWIRNQFICPTRYERGVRQLYTYHEKPSTGRPVEGLLGENEIVLNESE